MVGVLPIPNFSAGEECSICGNTLPKDIIADIVQLRACRKRYHTHCILTWLQGSHNDLLANRTCSMCRRELYRADLPPVSRFRNLSQGLWRPYRRPEHQREVIRKRRAARAVFGQLRLSSLDRTESTRSQSANAERDHRTDQQDSEGYSAPVIWQNSWRMPPVVQSNGRMSSSEENIK